MIFSGHVMTKFTIALREIATYKEVFRSQVVICFACHDAYFVLIDFSELKFLNLFSDRAHAK